MELRQYHTRVYRSRVTFPKFECALNLYYKNKFTSAHTMPFECRYHISHYLHQFGNGMQSFMAKTKKRIAATDRKSIVILFLCLWCFHCDKALLLDEINSSQNENNAKKKKSIFTTRLQHDLGVVLCCLHIRFFFLLCTLNTWEYRYRNEFWKRNHLIRKWKCEIQLPKSWQL